MTLPLTSHWRQGSPYNDQCPELTPGADEHTVVGCVATAMAQIMYYWKWPNTGVGDGSVTYNYRWRNTWDEEPLTSNPGIPPGWAGRLEYNTNTLRLRMNGYWDQSLFEAAQVITQSSSYQNALESLWDRLTNASTNHYANFGATTYNWNLLTNVHTDPPDAGDVEVAKLSYHAGIAVDMDYGVRGSGTNMPPVVAALTDHFRYDSDATLDSRDIYVMTEEIQWLRPIEIAGFDASGGHAWVAYGYNKGTDPNRQFLMNLGWGGSSDGWYSCDKIFPDSQQHVTRIAPKDVVKFVGVTDPGDGSPGDPYQGIEEAVVEAPNEATLIFKTGSDNIFLAATLIISRPLTLKAQDATIRQRGMSATTDNTREQVAALKRPQPDERSDQSNGEPKLPQGVVLMAGLVGLVCAIRGGSSLYLAKARATREGKIAILVILIVVLLLTGMAYTHAQTGGYDLTWSMIGSGGGVSSGGNYALNSTIGQSAVGVASSGSYTLVGGFWSGAVVQYRVYLPMVLRE
jgi:hypothetical protein